MAIEAARRVRAEPVGAPSAKRAGLRPRQCRQVLLRMPAASARRAAKVIAERKRGAQPCVAQLGRLVEQPVRHRPHHPGRDLPDEGLCLGAQGAADADDKGEKPQTGVRLAGGLAWYTGLVSSVGLLKETNGAPRRATWPCVGAR